MGKSGRSIGFASVSASGEGLEAGGEANGARRDPVAIVGIGCRFPGAEGPEAFWRLLRDGVDAITEIPPDRFDLDGVYDPRPGIPGKLYTRWGGFLDGVDRFDPYFFGISAREAAAMDPQQRLLLEVAWEALEDGGLVPGELDGDRTGVFVGMCNSDYQHLLEDPADIDIYFAGGVALSVLSGRLSFVLGLRGPSTTIDTACSTSLVAVHLACQSLWSGESTLALAGGVNLILSPDPYMGFCQARMLAPDGRCKFGDARADGFVRSEGAGVVALKPLSMALADGDPVYAVIRGSATNNDGDSGGMLMTPSVAGQEAVFRAAYRDAGVSPGEARYVEVHGTGTSVGDPVETRALGRVLLDGRPEGRPCAIGSAKTNIGHAEGAAGIAGLIKVALSMRHGTIPPSLHFEEPNPNISWEELPLAVQREPGPWPEGPALAGVSSFGISGTNAHVVVQGAPETAPRTETADAAGDYLLPVSAHAPESLGEMARAYRDFLLDGGTGGAGPSLRDACYTASQRRTHHDHRLAVAGGSRRELAEGLEAFLGGEPRPGLSSGRKVGDLRPKVVFVFSGQGSQWVGMGRDLMRKEPVFWEAMGRCDRVIHPLTGWSLLDELAADEKESRLGEVDVVQPAIFAVQVALTALWRSWGVEPDAVVGQSLGEVAAAHAAGALTLEDAARVICRRSQLVKKTGGRGGMAVVQLPLAETEHALAGREDRVSVAVSSSPSSTVISGDAAALGEIMAELEERDVFCRRIKVDYASHSPQVEPLRPDLLRALEGVKPRAATVPLYSTVSGEVEDGRGLDADYWVRNLREPVLFSAAVERLLEGGHDVFVELSPHPVLLNAVEEGLRSAGRDGVRQDGREGATLPSMREGEGPSVALGSLGALYTLGYPVDLKRLYPEGGRSVRLPSYRWRRERFWLEEEATDGHRNGGGAAPRRNGRGGLLGQHLRSAADPGTRFWEAGLGAGSPGYLDDHRVQGLAVLPAAAFVEMALSAAAEALGPGNHVLEDVDFRKALFLPEDGHKPVQLVFSAQSVGETSFRFFAEDGAAQGAPTQSAPTQSASALDASWALHATGRVRHDQAGPSGDGWADGEAQARVHGSPDEIRARCAEEVSGEELYEALGGRGLQYGPAFRGVGRIWRRDGEAVGNLRLTDAVASGRGAYRVHPALLDACFQVLAATMRWEGADGEDVYLPVGLGRLRAHDVPDGGLWGHALLKPGASAGADELVGDVFLLDEDGRVVVEATGLRLRRIERETRREAGQEDPADWLYEVEWEPKALSEQNEASDGRGSWLVFADDGGVGKRLVDLLEARGESCVVAYPGDAYAEEGPGRYTLDPADPEGFRRLLADVREAGLPSLRGALYLWGLESGPPEEVTPDYLDGARTLGCVGALHLVQALVHKETGDASGLWLVTRGTQAATEGPVSVGQSPLWGLGRVVSVEHPELGCREVDLDPSGGPDEVRSVFRELWSGDGEDQVALRGGERYVPRVVRSSPGTADERKEIASPEEPFRLEIPTPGILDEMLLRRGGRREPGPGEVEIRVRAVGLNFRDVLIAMDLVPPVFEGRFNVGFECAGEIARVGEGVEDFEAGDGVIAGVPTGCFGSFATTGTSLVMPKPSGLSFEEAATIPIAFLTAYYALSHLGRLGKGERVLIHAAAGGVGLAAVQLAKRAGAEIFATAGSDEKRDFLRSLGVRHVMNSRTLDFADEVMDITGGEGVDMVLNSLAGEFIPKSLSTLRTGGRFLEIGKVDVLRNTQIGLALLENNVSFSTIDLSKLFLERPELSRSLLRGAMRYFDDGSLGPLPLETFRISRVAEAFRYMAQAKHIGKVVVSLDEEEIPVAPATGAPPVRADGTYLVTGGAGGLGLSTARWLVEKGARNLVLTGRSGASAAAREAIAALEADGARVIVAKADVSDEGEIGVVLEEIRRRMPPLRGVFHSAGVLDDGVLSQQSEERFAKVMAPKVEGAWNLHRLTLEDEPDLFVLFSSAASVLGSPGQGNYVAANAFLDALAHHRRALGLPALAINWGAWAEVGLATREDRVGHLTRQGIVPFTPEQGTRLMQLMLERDAARCMGIAADWSRLLAAYAPPLLSRLAEETAGEQKPGKQDGLTRERLLAAEPEERRRLVEGFLVEQLAWVLRCSPSKVDPHQPLNRLGIDSLMAVELKNRVEADLETAVPVTVLLQGPSMVGLATHLLEQLDAASVPPGDGEAGELMPNVDELSDEEVDSLLRDLSDEDLSEVENG